MERHIYLKEAVLCGFPMNYWKRFPAICKEPNELLNITIIIFCIIMQQEMHDCGVFDDKL